MRLIDADKVPYVVIDGFEYVQREDIEQMDTIDPAAPVEQGYWENPCNDTLECSQCGAWSEKVLLRQYYIPRYCGYCGARMDGKTLEGLLRRGFKTIPTDKKAYKKRS